MFHSPPNSVIPVFELTDKSKWLISFLCPLTFCFTWLAYIPWLNMTVMKETMGKNNGIQQPRGACRKLSSNYPVKVTHGPMMELFFIPHSSLKAITQITTKKKSVKYLEYVTFKSFHSLFWRDIPLFLSKRKKRPRKSQSRSSITCGRSPGR